MNTKTLILAVFAIALSATGTTATFAQDPMNDSKPRAMNMTVYAQTINFKGVEVNKGHATLARKNGKTTLTLSSDFELPNTPAPHWQVVDGNGNVYLLQQLKIVGNKKNLSITLPAHVKSVKKVQIWCSFAEVLLG